MRRVVAVLFSVVMLLDCGPAASDGHPVAAPSPTPSQPSASSQVGSPSGDPATAPVHSAEAVIRGPLHAAAKECFAEALRTNPGEAGRVVVVIHVAPDGQVSEATIGRNDGLPSGVGDCIASAPKRLQFDPPGDKGATISVPFNFVRSTTAATAPN